MFTFWTFIDSLMPVLVLILLWYIAKRLWYHYVTRDFIAGIDWILLEIRIPRELHRGPQAMELVMMNALYQLSHKSWYEIWWGGAVKLPFSCEIASIDGRVHFYIRTPSRIKDLVEIQIYAQYPQAEVLEVEDYSMQVPAVIPNKEWNLWGCEFKFIGPDAYPIRTYIDYGIDKTSTEEEEKDDPLTGTLELLGSMKRGEQMWVQIMIRASGKKYHTPHTLFGTHDWTEESELELAKIYKSYEAYARKGSKGEITQLGIPRFAEDTVKQIDEKRDKLGFDVSIRCMYVARRELFTKARYRGMRLIFRQFESPNYNGFSRIHSTQVYYPWADLSGKVVPHMKHRMLEDYRLRRSFYMPLFRSFRYPYLINFFFPDFKPYIMVLNSEELATIFHFPGRVSYTPTLRRIESKTAEPPWNLPL